MFHMDCLKNKLSMGARLYPTSHNNIQRQAIRREYEPVGLILLKDPLGARWGLLPTLWLLVFFFVK